MELFTSTDQILDIDFVIHNSLSVSRTIPTSEVFEIRSSGTSGRGVFSKTPIGNGTTVFRTNGKDQSRPHNGLNGCQNKTVSDTDALYSPIAYTIFREYRKEVCGECLRYDRGREWKIRFDLSKTQRPHPNPHGSGAGIVFCSEDCRDEWFQRYGSLGVEAFITIEEAVRKAMKRIGLVITTNNATEENEDQNLTSNGQKHPKQTARQPGESIEEIRTMWTKADAVSRTIANARVKEDSSKADRKALRLAMEPKELSADICYYLLTGVLNAFTSASRNSQATHNEAATNTKSNGHDTANTTTTTSSVERLENQQQKSQKEPNIITKITTTSPLFQRLRSLAPDPTCYDHPASTLNLYKSSYLLLYATLPLPLLSYLTPVFAHELNSRASHNAFSIRPSSSSDGDQSGEMLGWGVWPSASLFNHSCASNLGKRRIGRTWEFYIDTNTNMNMNKQRFGAAGGSGGGSDEGYVKAGEELCITYLGGDEWDLDVVGRRRRLREEWGFECMCERCCVEDRERSVNA